MARTRSIKHSFFMNEELAELRCEARLLFIGLWTIADREGRLEDRPRKIKAAVFPYDECDVDTLLGDLAGKGFVRRYEAKGGRYVQINNFVKHQKPHPKETPSEIPVLDDGEHESPESREKDGQRREEDGHGPEKDRPRREEDGSSREKDGVGRERFGPGREKDRPSQEVDGPGRDIPDSGRYTPGPDLEKNKPIQEKPGLPKNKSKEEGEEGKDKRNAECGLRNGETEPGVRIIFEYWREKMGHPDAKLTREREMKIRGRLGEGYTVDQLKSAVDGCGGSAFHQGDNDRGHRYDDITLICRSGSKVEQFIEMTKEGGDERSQSRKRSNVKKIMEGLELVRSRIAQGGDPGDDNQQSEGGMLAAGARAG